MDSPKLKLHLLGRFAVEWDATPVAPSAWKRKRPVHLLTALALAQDYVLHREELIDRLWPDKDLDAGANNLYRTLHDLRKLTGDDVVHVERGTVRLNDDTWTDVRAFEQAASADAAPRWLDAVELYGGDLLPDDPYSDELAPRRQSLRQRFVDTALRVGRATDVEADRRIAVLRRLVDVDPTLEQGHRLLMQCLANAGRVNDATQQFAACVTALREHLDTAPSQETAELHARIKRGDVAPAPAPTPAQDDNWSHVATRLLGTDAPAPLRGRSDALGAATAFAESDRGALLIAGEAGAGKTRMAVECARLCAQHGAIILAGLGYDFEGTAPYTPFVDAWTDLLRLHPSGDNPFLSFEPTPGGSAQEDRLRLFQSVERSLTTLAGDGAACILIEDLHQADESSLHLFHHLARSARRLPIKLIGTLREEEIRPGNPLHVLMSSLGRERTAARIRVDRLDLDATRELVADLWGKAPDDAVVSTIYELAAGNPFYTEEVAAALVESDGAALSRSEDLVQTVRDRVARLGDEAERLLVAAAVQGVRFEFEIAHRSIDMAAEPALDALDVALAAHIVEEQGHHYRFHHALIRESLYDSLSAARRVFMHRATCKAFEDRGGPFLESEPEVLAHHHHAAGNLEEALPYTLAAISRAQARLGFGEAVTQSQRAIELMTTLGKVGTAEHFDVLRNMGAMRVALGDLDEAVRDLDLAARQRGPSWTPSPVQQCSAKRLAGLALIEAGNLREAEVRLDEALQRLGDAEDPAELSNLYYLYSQLRWHQSRHDEAFALAEKCLGYAEQCGSNAAIAKGYEMLALACHSLGEWKKGRDYEEQRRDVADGTLDVASAFDVHL